MLTHSVIRRTLEAAYYFSLITILVLQMKKLRLSLISKFRDSVVFNF